jgi:exodeoxyribonuclease V alpha subunit
MFLRCKVRRKDGKQHRYWSVVENLVYTGVTRGKRLVVLVGQRKALAIAFKGGRTRRRWSKLREWLIGGDMPSTKRAES